ncbi:MAG: epoxyqueuosine reductase [Promethearchaeota archaeon]
MGTISEEIHEFLDSFGVIKSGITNLAGLDRGPPSTDLTYILPSAKSAISYALPYDRAITRNYLAKKNVLEFEEHGNELDKKINIIAKKLAGFLKNKGFEAVAVASNNVYRKEGIHNWQLRMYPDLSHRFIAVASGLGSFGWSGSVGIEGYGTAILLGTVVTNAELEITQPIPEDEGFCTSCKVCVNSCVGGFFDRDEIQTVTLGGREFHYSKRRNTLSCQFVCSGLTGLHKSGKWSTWSPGRYDLPEDKKELYKKFNRALGNYAAWPKRSDGGIAVENATAQGLEIRSTCGNCGLVCWGDPKETAENYRLLTSNGCAIMNQSGDLYFLPPEQAAEEFEKFPRSYQRKFKILKKKTK